MHASILVGLLIFCEPLVRTSCLVLSVSINKCCVEYYISIKNIKTCSVYQKMALRQLLKKDNYFLVLYYEDNKHQVRRRGLVKTDCGDDEVMYTAYVIM